ncbi:MAG: cytochrome c oxidase accessory protein CcoG [Gammaproteobacteria bacterium]|nr:MAG: cytochrome c oxidase accessory protein CcoG [Gammaproteobacteria bacterium]
MSTQATENPDKALYAAHKKIYPREVTGKFSRLRVIAFISLLGIYYVMPLLRWDDRQALLFDLPARKFYLFGLTLWPQDFIYLAALLIMAGLALFFFTALFGRIWCGYACPQTVWTEAYLWMERKIEGNRSRRMKLDKARNSAAKIRTKVVKHTVWILFSLWTGFTFVAYFTPIDELANKLLTGNLGPWETFWILFYSFATYGNAGFMREQVCLYMCPYARFQSAMFDSDTLIVAYHPERGEPRGSRRRGSDPREQGLGDCIDCNVCVQVCPTGIDIRDGLQYECIACSACIDGCDEIMDKMNYPRGLIRYTTENSTLGQPQNLLRPRIMVYAAILLILLGSLLTHMLYRIPLELDVIRDRNTLYRETREGLIENVYTLKILNMDSKSHQYILSADGIDGLKLVLDEPVIEVPAGTVHQLIARIQADEFNMENRSETITFRLQAQDANHLLTSEEARFVGPGKN